MRRSMDCRTWSAMIERSLPVERDAQSLADWIETSLLLEPRVPLGSAGFGHGADGQGHLTGADLNLAHNAMARRSQLLGTEYPFLVQSVGAACRANAAECVYAALLLLAVPDAPFRRRSGTLGQGAELFERVTCLAAGGIFGPETQALRFAWPSDEGRPSGFPEAVSWLSKRMGIPLGTAFRPPRRQDGGVDVIAWRSFADGMPGFPTVLIQCTIERDFVQKAADVDTRLWSGWLRLEVDPLTALTIPFVVSPGEDWNEMSSRTLVMDRLRLIRLLAGRSTTVPGLIDWTAAQLQQLRGD